MKKTPKILIISLISGLLITGCTSSKKRVFGESMPTMKTIHDQKFAQADIPLPQPKRAIGDNDGHSLKQPLWLPNPTLEVYVFPHLSGAGHPIPGYSTYIRLYDRDHIALPYEVMRSQ
ncbi:hypothetical protein ACVBEJ_00100 [Porticoccus sp. GXU_MW_L64]